MTDVFNIAHGAGGLWERHQWNSDVTLNVQDAVDGGGAPIRERITIDTIGGLHRLGDRVDASTPRVGRIGDNHRRTTMRGKTVTYKGELLASTFPKGFVLRSAMLAAFAFNDGFGYMDLIRHPDEGGPTGRFYAQVLDLDIPDENTDESFRRDYTLGLRLSDPRVYFPSLAVDVTGSPSAVNNTGNAPVEPVLTVAGASGTVVVSDGTHTLKFANVPSGTLVIDFAARTARVGATDCELVVADSDWWDSFVYGIAPGSHSITQTGGSSVRVQFTPAVWG